MNLVLLLTGAERLVARRLAAILDADGRTVDEFRVLTLLAEGAGQTMTELAERAFLPAPSLTRLVDRLVADNLIYRRVDGADRRRILAYLTARGRRLHQRLSEAVRSGLTELAGQEPLEQLLAGLIDALSGAPARRPRPELR